VDEFLWPLSRGLVASPGYLSQHEAPEHLHQLATHQCLVYQPTGASWSFLAKAGVISVSVHPRLSSNDLLMLREAEWVEWAKSKTEALNPFGVGAARDVPGYREGNPVVIANVPARHPTCSRAWGSCRGGNDSNSPHYFQSHWRIAEPFEYGALLETGAMASDAASGRWAQPARLLGIFIRTSQRHSVEVRRRDT
jgi:hypothetical protein